MQTVFFICLLLLGCTTTQMTEDAVLRETSRVEGVTFETGKDKGKVIDAVLNMVMDDGFDVEPLTDETGNIVCKPRFMLRGILMEKTEGKKWNATSKPSTLNYRVFLSAHVGEKGVVQLKAVVMAPGLDPSIDYSKSAKLAAYYERAVKKKLRIPFAL